MAGASGSPDACAVEGLLRLHADAFDRLDPDRFLWLTVGRARGLVVHGGRDGFPLLVLAPISPAGHVAVLFVDRQRMDRRVIGSPHLLDDELDDLVDRLRTLSDLPPASQGSAVTWSLETFQRRVATQPTALTRTAAAARPRRGRSRRPGPVAFLKHLTRQAARGA